MVNSNMPMEMSPEWKAITKCESKIEALEDNFQKYDTSRDFRMDELEGQIAELKEELEALHQAILNESKVNLRLEQKVEDIFKSMHGIEKPLEPVWSSRRLRDRQLKRHYSGKDKHELCLTCETIVSRDLINEFQQDLDDLSPLIPYSYEPLHDLRKKWEARKV